MFLFFWYARSWQLANAASGKLIVQNCHACNCASPNAAPGTDVPPCWTVHQQHHFQCHAHMYIWHHEGAQRGKPPILEILMRGTRLNMAQIKPDLAPHFQINLLHFQFHCRSARFIPVFVSSRSYPLQ